MPEKSVAQKLQIKPGKTIYIANPPQSYEQLLGPLPEGVTVLTEPAGLVDFIQVFIANRQELEGQLGRLKAWLKSDGALWVTYHKGTSKIKSDIHRDSINAFAQTLGMEGVAMISVDDDWSALRLKIVK